MPSEADGLLARASALAAKRAAASPKPDHPAAKRAGARLKAALTRATGTNDPEQVILACRDAVLAWREPPFDGAWPDDWSVWQRALHDTIGSNSGVSLNDLADAAIQTARGDGDGEQHGFRIAVEVVEPGEYPTAFHAALQTAQHLFDLLDEAAILVTATGQATFQGVPNGVYCEGCDGHVFPGVRWPTEANGDTRHQWVERCDTCERYPTDAAAAAYVARTYRDAGEPHTTGTARPEGSSRRTPFVELCSARPTPDGRNATPSRPAPTVFGAAPR